TREPSRSHLMELSCTQRTLPALSPHTRVSHFFLKPRHWDLWNLFSAVGQRVSRRASYPSCTSNLLSTIGPNTDVFYIDVTSICRMRWKTFRAFQAQRSC